MRFRAARCGSTRRDTAQHGATRRNTARPRDRATPTPSSTVGPSFSSCVATASSAPAPVVLSRRAPATVRRTAIGGARPGGRLGTVMPACYHGRRRIHHIEQPACRPPCATPPGAASRRAGSPAGWLAPATTSGTRSRFRSSGAGPRRASGRQRGRPAAGRGICVQGPVSRVKLESWLQKARSRAAAATVTFREVALRRTGVGPS